MTDKYSLIVKQTSALTEGVDYTVTNLANTAALLWHSLDNLNWIGFYLLIDGKLKLAPFMGKPACTVILMGKGNGVCGTAAALGKTVIAPDVHEFPGHIACDSESASEIVVPIIKNGKVVGVLDADSPVKSRFDASDACGLEAVARVIAENCTF